MTNAIIAIWAKYFCSSL